MYIYQRIFTAVQRNSLRSSLKQLAFCDLALFNKWDIIRCCRTSHTSASTSWQTVTYDGPVRKSRTTVGISTSTGIFTCAIKGAYKFEFAAMKVGFSFSKIVCIQQYNVIPFHHSRMLPTLPISDCSKMDQSKKRCTATTVNIIKLFTLQQSWS